MSFQTVRIVGRPKLDSSDLPFPTQAFLSAYCPPDRPGVTRYFCPVCSAHILLHVSVGPDGKIQEEPPACIHGQDAIDHLPTLERIWRVAGGALQQSEGIIQPACHTHVSSTQDGGFAEQLRCVNGVDLVRFSEGIGSDILPPDWRSPDLKPMKSDEELEAYCHCGAITLILSRPDAQATLPTAPYPDIIYPADTTRLSKKRNIHDDKWWLRPPISEGKSTRYLAGHCVCSCCRLSSASEVQSWGFIVRLPVREAGKDRPLVFSEEELRPKGLNRYIPSPGRYEEFCRTCGATACCWTAGRPDVIVLDMGLVNQDQDGARAENWFDWQRKRVSYSETAKCPQLVEGLLQGLQEM